MFKNLFKSEAKISLQKSFIESIFKKAKTQNEIIDEIHETFYTEVDRLLADAKIKRSTETILQSLIDKATRLKALGFEKTTECLGADIEIYRIKRLTELNEKKDDIRAAIEYFSHKYPHYKFITRQSVIKICRKYNLIYGDVSKYKGSVPEKTLSTLRILK